MEKSLSPPIEKQDFFQHLIEELEAIETETNYNANIEVIRGKFLAGKAIIEMRGEFKRFGYGDKMVSVIAQYWGKSPAFVYHLVEFAQLFKTWEEAERNLPDDKATSWSKVVQNLLSSGKTKKKTIVKRLTIDEIKEMILECIDREKLIACEYNIFALLEDPKEAQEIMKRFLRKLDRLNGKK